jgi:hypothetical protein
MDKLAGMLGGLGVDPARYTQANQEARNEVVRRILSGGSARRRLRRDAAWTHFWTN